MKHRKHRKWELTDVDPTSGLINLFDIWMVFAVALLLALIQTGALQTAAAKSSAPDKSQPDRAQIDSRKAHVTKMRLTQDQLTGEGQRLGTAYRLKSGELVYVPDTPPTP
jgi:hypothetical protein